MCAYQMKGNVFDQVINAHPVTKVCKQLWKHDLHPQRVPRANERQRIFKQLIAPLKAKGII